MLEKEKSVKYEQGGVGRCLGEVALLHLSCGTFCISFHVSTALVSSSS